MKNINNKTKDLTAKFRKTKSERNRYWTGYIAISDFTGDYPNYISQFTPKVRSAITFSRWLDNTNKNNYKKGDH